MRHIVPGAVPSLEDDAAPAGNEAAGLARQTYQTTP